MKYSIVLLLILTLCFESKAGSFDSLPSPKYRVIRGITISPFSNFTLGPATGVDTSIYSKGYIGSTYSTVSIAIGYYLKFGLCRFNRESGLSLNLPFTFGVGAYMNDDIGTGVLHLSLPATISYDYGAGSTFVSEAEKGYSIGLGVEANLFPAFYIEHGMAEAGEDAPIVAKYSKSFFMMPVLTYSKRKWSKNSDFLKNKILKLGMMPYQYTDMSTNTTKSSLMFSLGFSFGGFSNY